MTNLPKLDRESSCTTCVKCSPPSRKWWVFGGGVFLMIVAVPMVIFWPRLANMILRNELKMEKGTMLFETWMKLPVPIYMTFWMFNWTNSEDIRLPNYKPNLVELGPYVFLEKHMRENVTFHPDRDSLSFDQVRTWHFRPELSNGSLDDMVTNVNVMAASAAYLLRNENRVIKFAADKVMRGLKTRLTYTRTVRELLFDGFDDPLLTLVQSLPIPNKPPFKKFGWFFSRNGSWTYDGNFEFRSGQADRTQTGNLLRWNNMTKTRFYREDCNAVKGTLGEVWPMDMNPNDDITMFITDLCRPLTLSYQGQHTQSGIDGVRWASDARMYDNGENYPPNSCFCTSKEESCPDLLPGLQNVSECKYGAPAFASNPHFYLAHPAYVDAVTGIKPNKKLHQITLALETSTGIPLQVDAKVQINVLIQSVKGFALYKDIPKLFIPAFWFAQTVELTGGTALLVNAALHLPIIGVCIAYILIGIATVLLAVGTYFTWTKSWKVDQK